MAGPRACLALIIAVLAAGGLAAAALAQEGWFGGRGRVEDAEAEGNSAYDGRFVFVRLRYAASSGGLGFRRGRLAPWAHDYPRADVHFMKILEATTFIAPRIDGSNILALDDPALFAFPVAYMSEPGFWRPSDTEVDGLRAYLTKGGFVIFDDFDGPDLDNLKEQMRRVLPDGRFVELDGSHPIFHSFFDIDAPLEFIPPYGQGQPVFYGMFEDNDPAKRLIAVANFNNDIGEYWEFSDTGLVPIDLSNEAYKLGVNYVVYAMTH
ncbi:MAG: DUF4159 domain-containing protein [Acidobacteria bacterium]|nr:DUF4159 domain-containing protein [Acidobacteriota bacterium]